MHVFLVLAFFSGFSCDPVRCVVTLLRVHVPGCAIGWYCGSSGDNDWMIRICVFCLRQSVALCDAVSAATMVGRSVFVFCLRQFVALCDAGSAAIMVGRSVFVCSAFVNLSLSGCDAVRGWERVDMAGAGEVSFLRVCAECPCCLLLSGSSIVSILTRSHTDSKASGLLCPRVLTAE